VNPMAAMKASFSTSTSCLHIGHGTAGADLIRRKSEGSCSCTCRGPATRLTCLGVEGFGATAAALAASAGRWRQLRRRAYGATETELEQIPFVLPSDWTPAQPVPSPFPLGWFLDQGFPASGRFLWADGTHRAGHQRRGMRSGLHELPSDLAPWLEVSPAAEYAGEMEAKHEALMNTPEWCFVSDGASSLPAQREVLDLILEHLTQHEPTRFAVEDAVRGNNGRMVHTLTPGYTHTFAEEAFKDAPLRLAGLLVQEDLCLMRQVPLGDVSSGQQVRGAPVSDHIFVAGAVCFSFSPPERHMLPMSALHHPAVPGYAQNLDNPMNRFFSTLRPERSFWRANFSFGEFLEEDAAENEPPPLLTADDARQRLWLRVEYETIRRLRHASDYTLFTIKAYSDPLSSLEAAPGAARSLAAAIRECEPAFLAYKGLQTPEATSAVLAYLDSLCGGGAKNSHSNGR